MSTNQIELLTVREVAEELRLTPPTIRRLVDTGALPAIRLGNATLRFRREDVDRLLTPVVVRVPEEEDPE
jgi:excisionase family DNA binding protein